jgi:hypothetical protein
VSVALNYLWSGISAQTAQTVNGTVTKLGQLTREERYPISLLEPFSLLFSITGVDRALTEGFQSHRIGFNLVGEASREPKSDHIVRISNFYNAVRAINFCTCPA